MPILIKVYLVLINFSTVAFLIPIMSLPRIILLLALLNLFIQFITKGTTFKSILREFVDVLEPEDFYLFLFYITLFFNSLRTDANFKYFIAYSFSIGVQYIFVKYMLNKLSVIELKRFISWGLLIVSIFVIVEFYLSNKYDFNIRSALNLVNGDVGAGYLRTYKRAYGLSLEPNYLGIYLGSVFPILLSYLYGISEDRSNKYYKLIYIIIIFPILAMLFTFSANLFVIVIFNFVFLFVYLLIKIQKQDRSDSSNYKIFLMIAFSLAIIFFVKFYIGDYLAPIFLKIRALFDVKNPTGRLENWIKNWELFLEKPLIGHGLGYSNKLYGVSAINWYLSILSEAGIVSFVPFALFLYKKYIRILKSRKLWMLIPMNVILLSMVASSVFYDPIIWLIFATTIKLVEY